MVTSPRTPAPRPPRMRFAEATPVVLRPKIGKCVAARLDVISITGGLLTVPRPFERGCNVNLMFLSTKGAVSGAVQMLAPLCWNQQPFRFVALAEDDQRKLKTAIQASLSWTENMGRVESHRAW